MIFASEEFPNFLKNSVYPIFFGVLYRRIFRVSSLPQSGNRNQDVTKEFKKTLEAEPTGLADNLKRSRGYERTRELRIFLDCLLAQWSDAIHLNEESWG